MNLFFSCFMFLQMISMFWIFYAEIYAICILNINSDIHVSLFTEFLISI